RIAEGLKPARSSLLTRGLANAVHNTVPIAAGRRIAHVRVAAPIAVRVADGARETDGGSAARAALLAEHRSRLQGLVDRIGAEVAPEVARFRLPNPLHAASRSV